MGFTNGAYAKIKEVEEKGSFTKVKISISKKVKGSDPAKYVCTYAGWVNFVGKAHINRPMTGQKIKITNCDVTNGYLDRNTGDQKFSQSPMCTVFEYELQADGQGNVYVNNEQAGNIGSFGTLDFASEDSLPFD